MRDGDHPVLAHFDEKQMEYDFDGKKDSSPVMVTTFSSPDTTHCQLAGATLMENSSRVEIAGQVHNLVEGVDVSQQVRLAT